jgi:hypothetical protein
MALAGETEGEKPPGTRKSEMGQRQSPLENPDLRVPLRLMFN